MWTLDEILENLEHSEDRLRALGVTRLGVFGSYRQGTATQTSDMDFLVSFAAPTFDCYISVKILLEDLFDSTVDLVMEEDLREELRSRVLAEVVYAETA